MYCYGLTGGIGCGKSKVATMFAGYHDVGVISTDEIARKIMLNPEILQYIADFCNPQPTEILIKENSLDAERFLTTTFANAFFTNQTLKARVETLVHPKVWEEVNRLVNSDKNKIWIVESAIIYEHCDESRFNDVISVYCSPETQIERLLERGYPPEKIAMRLNSQQSAVSKKRKSRYVIETDGTLKETRRQVDTIYYELKARYKDA